MKVITKDRIKSVLNDIWFQEILLGVLDISLKAGLAIVGMFCKDRINPYIFAAILICTQLTILALIVRGSCFNERNRYKEATILENLGTDTSNSINHEEQKIGKGISKFNQEQKLMCSICGMVVFQSLYIVLSVIGPLLNQYKQIAIEGSVAMGVIAFICGIIPQSIFNATSVAYSRVNLSRIEGISNSIKNNSSDINTTFSI